MSYSAEQRQQLLKEGKALPGLKNGEPRYPIDNLKDLGDAIQSIGRTKGADRHMVLLFILQRAQQLNASPDLIAHIKQLISVGAVVVDVDSSFVWADGTKVTWHYRSAIGHGTIVGVHKFGTSHATTEYSIREDDHHVSQSGSKEPAIVYHYGSALTKAD